MFEMSEGLAIFVGMVFITVFLLSQGLIVPVFGEGNKMRKRLKERLEEIDEEDDEESMSSLLSHNTRDILILRISANCSRVKLLGHPPFSYQNRSPLRNKLNCLPKMQAKVGPTMEPGKGFSAMPAECMTTPAVATTR